MTQPAKRIHLTNLDGEVHGALIGHALSKQHQGEPSVACALMAIAEGLNNVADAVRELGVPTITTTVPVSAPAAPRPVPIVRPNGRRR